MANVIEFDTMEEAKQYASTGNGPYLVLSRETVDQIEAAEATGGFEGGQTGASGEGGYSAPASGGVDSSFSSDPAPIEELDLDGAVRVGAWFEWAGERVIDLHEAWEAFHGNPLIPLILVPKEELDRWLGNSGPSA
jgi:hypothetical protein